MQIKHVLEEVFCFNVTFISDCSVDEANEYIKSNKISEENIRDNCAGQSWVEGENIGIIYVKDSIKQFDVAHEIFHIVVDILEQVGVPIEGTRQSDGKRMDETGAYLMDFFMRKFYE